MIHQDCDSQNRSPTVDPCSPLFRSQGGTTSKNPDSIATGFCLWIPEYAWQPSPYSRSCGINVGIWLVPLTARELGRKRRVAGSQRHLNHRGSDQYGGLDKLYHGSSGITGRSAEAAEHEVAQHGKRGKCGCQ